MSMKNTFDIGGMRVRLFLPPEHVPEGTIVPRLAHGSSIVAIVSGDEDISVCDALVTKNHNLPLGIKTADCAPICFGDGETIGIAHVGWRGLCLGLVEKMIPYFNTASVAIYVAPFLHSFEIKKDSCYDRIIEKFGERFLAHESGKIFFHFKDALLSLLPPDTACDPRNTAIDLSLPSHRRKTNSRFAIVVRFKA